MSRVPQITSSTSQRRFGNVLPPPMDDFNSRLGLDKHPVKRTCIVSPYFPDAKDFCEIGSATFYSDIMHIMLLCVGLILPLYIDLNFFFFRIRQSRLKVLLILVPKYPMLYQQLLHGMFVFVPYLVNGLFC